MLDCLSFSSSWFEGLDDCKFDSLNGFLIVRFVLLYVSFNDLLIGCLIDSNLDRELIGWFVGWLVDRLLL